MKMFEVMDREIVFATPSTHATEALKQMTAFSQPELLVCEDGKVIGTVASHDLLESECGAYTTVNDFRNVVGQHMRHGHPFCYESDELEVAVGRILSDRAEVIAVLDNEERLSGVMTLSQISHFIATEPIRSTFVV